LVCGGAVLIYSWMRSSRLIGGVMPIGKKGLSLGCRKRPSLKFSAKEVLLDLGVYIVNAVI